MEKDTNRIRRVFPVVQGTAKVLRQTMTPAEKVLWNALRGDQFKGLHVRRQHPVGQYILDFYISSYRLVIEVDGSIHENQKEMDEVRSEYLRSLGSHVLRFKNDEVLLDIHTVLKQIEETVKYLKSLHEETTGQ